MCNIDHYFIKEKNDFNLLTNKKCLSQIRCYKRMKKKIALQKLHWLGEHNWLARYVLLYLAQSENPGPGTNSSTQSCLVSRQRNYWHLNLEVWPRGQILLRSSTGKYGKKKKNLNASGLIKLDTWNIKLPGHFRWTVSAKQGPVPRTEGPSRNLRHKAKCQEKP